MFSVSTILSDENIENLILLFTFIYSCNWARIFNFSCDKKSIKLQYYITHCARVNDVLKLMH